MLGRLSHKLQFFWYVWKYNWVVKKHKFPKVETIETTLKTIIEKRLSIARFGDGELNMLYFNNIGFQNYDAQLARRLKEILLDCKNSKCLISLPPSLHGLDGFTLSAKMMFRFLISKYYRRYHDCIDFNYVYPNSFISRPYMDYENKQHCRRYFENLKNVWRGRSVVIVEGFNTKFGIGNDLLEGANDVARVLTLSKNAYSIYNRIITEVINAVPKDKLILISLGPTATVLAYDLAQEGYQAIDIGHLDIEYEWFLKNRQIKTKVEGKDVNEVKDGFIQESSRSILQNETILMEIR